jgi:hypothetical protein
VFKTRRTKDDHVPLYEKAHQQLIVKYIMREGEPVFSKIRGQEFSNIILVNEDREAFVIAVKEIAKRNIIVDIQFIPSAMTSYSALIFVQLKN